MIILTNTSDKIQVTLSNNTVSSNMMCYASYRDTTSSAISPLRNVISTNNTTAIDLVDSPTASTQRIIDYLSIYNTDTVSNEVTILFNNGTNTYRLFVAKIATGDKIEYQEGYGFKVIGNGYSTKTATVFNNVVDPSDFGIFVLGNDVVSNGIVANAGIEVPNLTVPVKANNGYWFRYVLFFDANATTTGSKWNIYGPEGVIYYYITFPITSTTQYIMGGQSVYNTPGGPQATSPATTGNVTLIEGFLRVSRDGFIIPIFASELASPNNITLKADSFVMYKKTI
jgi:hypothetical protein